VIHYITLRAIAHATEDVSRVRAALDFFLSGAGVRENLGQPIEVRNVRAEVAPREGLGLTLFHPVFGKGNRRALDSRHEVSDGKTADRADRSAT